MNPSTRETVIKARRADPYLTLARIGEIAGVSSSRVRAILVTCGLATRALPRTKPCNECRAPLPIWKDQPDTCGDCIKARVAARRSTRPCDTCGDPVTRPDYYHGHALNHRYKNDVWFCSPNCFNTGRTTGGPNKKRTSNTSPTVRIRISPRIRDFQKILALKDTQ